MDRRSFLRLLLLAAMWGSSFMWIKIAVGTMPPAAVAFFRLLLGAAVLLAVVGRVGARLPHGGRFWADMAVLGLVNGAVPYTLFPVGEQYVSSGLAAIFNATTPLFTALVGWVAREEIPSVRSAAGVLLGFAGAALLFGDDLAGVGGEHLGGQLALLTASASYGVGFVYASRRVDKRVVTVPALGQQALGTLWLAPLFLAGLPAVRLTVASTVAVAWLGILSTGFAYLLYFSLVEEVGPTATSTVTYLLPVIALVLGVVFLDESIRLLDLIALGLIAAGIATLSRARGRFRGYQGVT